MTAGLHVCFVTANTFEYDSRTLRAAQALAADGHRVTVVALAGPGLAAEETLDGGIPSEDGGPLEPAPEAAEADALPADEPEPAEERTS